MAPSSCTLRRVAYLILFLQSGLAFAQDSSLTSGVERLSYIHHAHAVGLSVPSVPEIPLIGRQFLLG